MIASTFAQSSEQWPSTAPILLREINVQLSLKEINSGIQQQKNLFSLSSTSSQFLKLFSSEV